MSFWDTLGWSGSDAGWDAKGTRKGDPSWGSSDAGWGGMGTGKGGPSWGSSDAVGDGSCSGKGTRKGGSTGERSHGWSSPYAPPPPTFVPPGYEKGFRDGWQKGHNEGLPCGYGKGYARGMDASWEKGVAAFLEERTALGKGAARAGEDDDDEEPEAKKATRKNKQKRLYSDWCDAYLARDPPVEDIFPRFQVWNDYRWTDYQEKVNQSLRDSRYAKVDLGAIEEVAYQYEVHVVEEGSQDHDQVQGAVRNVKHHKCWQLEFPPQVVGWQSKFEEEGLKKTKTRPVRKLTSPDVSVAVVPEVSADTCTIINNALILHLFLRQ